ncbi:MAG TPA: LamG domain-containing protein, partial [Sedimentisphaerales bacterium]|nr:LamG domain-containing protein [Sedimentisphaerales bacterium]
MSLILPTFDKRIKPPLGTPLNPHLPINQGLVGCWLMNEGAGTLVRDASGNGLHGTGSGNPVWSIGHSGPCLTFDGTGDWFDAGDITVLDGRDQMSLFLWMKGTTDDSYITSKYAGSVYTYFCKTYRNTFYAYVMNASKTGVVAHGTDYAATVIDGQWHQVGFVYDGALVSVYIDGRVGSTTAALTGDLYNTTYPLRIGGLTRYDLGFTGSLESLCLWNRALSPSEIQSLYRDPYQMFRRSRIEWWGAVLDAPSGTDYSFTINDGMGVVDDRSNLASLIRSVAEGLGLSDNASPISSLLRTLSDAMGIEDAESASAAIVRGLNEAVGLTDAESKLSVAVRQVADSLGMADAAITLAVLLRTITDAQGITDGQTLARMVMMADDLGVSDELAKIVAYLRSQSDSVGMTDVRTRLHAAVREITETEGLSDSYSTAWAVLRTISETLGLTD